MGDNPNQTDLCPTPIGMIGPSGCECTVDPSNGVVVISKKNPYNTTYFVPRGSGNCCTGFAARSPRFPIVGLTLDSGVTIPLTSHEATGMTHG